MSSPIRVRLKVVLLLGIGLTSCAPSSSKWQPATKSPSTATQAASANWVKVRSNPPTWYPRGTRTDYPTDFRSGEWVSTGDRQGSRYFIPVHVTGTIPRQTLVKEALAAGSTRKQVGIATEDCVECLKTTGNLVVGVPLTILALYGAQAATDNRVTSDDYQFIAPFGP